MTDALAHADPAGARPASSARRCAAIRLGGESLFPDKSGALWWPAAGTLIVADLHFEKGSAHARRGVMLPPYDTAATLGRLEALMVRFAPRRLIALGDSFHDTGSGDRLAADDRDRLARIQAQCDWIWVAGNHDPHPPSGIGGQWHEEVAAGPLHFRHEPAARLRPGEVAGHLHPAAKLRRNGRVLRRRCFVSDAGRIVMPAFGAFTGGLDVLDAAFGALFPELDFSAWMLGARDVYRVSGRRLAG